MMLIKMVKYIYMTGTLQRAMRSCIHQHHELLMCSDAKQSTSAACTLIMLNISTQQPHQRHPSSLALHHYTLVYQIILAVRIRRPSPAS